jgi:hypothetical protein
LSDDNIFIKVFTEGRKKVARYPPDDGAQKMNIESTWNVDCLIGSFKKDENEKSDNINIGGGDIMFYNSGARQLLGSVKFIVYQSSDRITVNFEENATNKYTSCIQQLKTSFKDKIQTTTCRIERQLQSDHHNHYSYLCTIVVDYT